jgi:glycosyltransferase involved in cell wall biosynthesis
MPIVSVITPSLNQSKFLEQSITSVRNQVTDHVVEHILLDAGSSDGSIDIIQNHSQWLTFWRSGHDSGQSAAINEGFRRASGEIFCWVNSDDGLAPGAIQTMVEAFANCTGPAWAVGRSYIIDADSHVLGTSQSLDIDSLHSLVLFHNLLKQPGVFWNRSMWELAGPLNENLHYVMDFDLWLRFIQVAPPICLDSVVGIHRDHDLTKTSTAGSKNFCEQSIAISNNIPSHLPEYRLALRCLTRDISFAARVSMSTFQRKMALRYLRLSFQVDPLSAINESSLKALVKLISPFPLPVSPRFLGFV